MASDQARRATSHKIADTTTLLMREFDRRAEAVLKVHEERLTARQEQLESLMAAHTTQSASTLEAIQQIALSIRAGQVYALNQPSVAGSAYTTTPPAAVPAGEQRYSLTMNQWLGFFRRMTDVISRTGRLPDLPMLQHEFNAFLRGENWS